MATGCLLVIMLGENSAQCDTKTLSPINPLEAKSINTQDAIPIKDFSDEVNLDEEFSKFEPTEVSSDTYSKIALEAYRKGNYDTAILIFARCKPGSGTYYNLGLIYGRKKMYDKSIEFFRKTVKANQSSPDLHYILGIFYENKFKNSNAINEYSQALNLNISDTGIVHYRLARNYQKEKEYKKAILEYEILIKSIPTFAQFYYNLGKVYIEIKNYNKAEEELKKALFYNPQYFSAQKALEEIPDFLKRDQREEKAQNRDNMALTIGIILGLISIIALSRFIP